MRAVGLRLSLASVGERLDQHEEGGDDEARGAGGEREADGPNADELLPRLQVLVRWRLCKVAGRRE